MKIVGVGLNKTGTKTLRHCLQHWGMKHQSYDLEAFNLYRSGKIAELLDWMRNYDSFEDWPWPLIYREIDKQYPDAKFILTVRTTPEIWYTSLCKMAVRMGPFNRFEKHIYGYTMPQGHRQEHIDFYDRHNREVEEYFAGRPDKLLKICWKEEDDDKRLAEFLGFEPMDQPLPKVNRSATVYSGDNLWLAQANRLAFQARWNLTQALKRLRRKFLFKRR